MKILVTGGTGFIGAELLPILYEHNVVSLTRSKVTNARFINASLEDFFSQVIINEKFDVAIHLAGLAHDNSKSLSDFRLVNRDATIALAKQLADNGMGRFIFISSIGVNGNCTSDEIFSEESPINPPAEYALSKYEAEVELKKLSLQMGFELVIIRPPLVYGIDAPGNFAKLIKLAVTKIPLPFALVNNSRSYISVKNLCDFIKLSITHPNAANELFLVSDDKNHSTKELIEEIWSAKSIKSFMFPVPVFVFRFLLKILGKSNISTQLFDNLEIDSSKAKNLLSWKAKFNLSNTLK